ncbi:MAG TPA: hypothetical protein VNJ01_13895 [Bacteriovoracaceae bacterium]|nr:hypothetical protein [Bacteriovoracaceae bacterium]
MKTFFIILILTFNAAAETNNPACNEEYSVTPCLEKSYQEELLEMLLDNKEGVQKIHTSGEIGLMIEEHVEDPIVVTVLDFKMVEEEGNFDFRSTVKFEIKLSDCRGTDACLESYRWTVFATTIGNGYTKATAYKNYLEKL